MKVKALLIISSLLFGGIWQQLYSQCTIHESQLDDYIMDVYDVGERPGQTFQACQNGQITSVKIGFVLFDLATYDLYIEEAPGENRAMTTPPVATVIYSGPFTVLDTLVTFSLNTPFPVKNDGTTYRLAVDHHSTDTRFFELFALRGNSFSDYPDGLYVDENNRYQPNFDIDFEILVESSPVLPPPVEPPVENNDLVIPTFSQWGLLLYGLVLLNLGCWLVYPRSSI